VENQVDPTAPRVWQALLMDVAADLEFACPRCGTDVMARFYGPCPNCMIELTARFTGEARDVQAEAYVPKMNVTPNAVALKD
jgi:hypothetical protein